MRQDNYPHPVSDPEADGLPGYADDDSTADDRALSPRISDGPDPAPLPADRPLAVDRFGTTAEEQRIGESVDYKLAREEPEREPAGAATHADEGAALSEDMDQLSDDVTDIPPIQPNAGSPVSMYDVASEAEPAGRTGGPTAEESAMHEIRDR
jgi:hypothetical protein